MTSSEKKTSRPATRRAPREAVSRTTSGASGWPMLAVRASDELQDALMVEVEAQRTQGLMSNKQHLVVSILNEWLCARPARSEYARELQRQRGIVVEPEPGE